MNKFYLSRYFFWDQTSLGKKVRKYFLKLFIGNTTHPVHVGCGSDSIGGFINLDIRKTNASDIVVDCGDFYSFPKNSLSKIFCNAFIEHLYFSQHKNFFYSLNLALATDGVACFLAIPDFERVARAYLNSEKGIVSDRFDYFEAYRYTHGDPEAQPGWTQQLHKYILDKNYLSILMNSVGIQNYSFFNYCYPGEIVDVNLGMLIYKKNIPFADREMELTVFLDNLQTPKKFVDFTQPIKFVHH